MLKRAGCWPAILLTISVLPVSAVAESTAVEEPPSTEAGPPNETAGEARRASADKVADVGEMPLGPVRVRPFAPMAVRLLRLTESHRWVYFQSPFAEPSPADAAIDRCVPLAIGVALADWFSFTGQALTFPVQMLVWPPWHTRPLAPQAAPPPPDS